MYFLDVQKIMERIPSKCFSHFIDEETEGPKG